MRPSWRFTVLLCGVAAQASGRAPAAPGAPAASGTSYHVAPAGTARGTGSHARPWDLTTALAGAGGRIQPGDTIWLAGGTYRGSYRTRLNGAPERPIVFRQRRGERATIDGTLRAEGSHLTFWGFEIMQSDPVRGGYGLEARTNGGRFINLVIHDAGTMGVSFWTPGENAELYGCIVYNNGTHDNLDHGVYVHNVRGTKVLADNVFFNNLAYGIHLYAGRRNPPQRGVRVQGNIAFNNGTISQRYRAKGNILVGGEVPMAAMEVLDNLLYFQGGAGENLRLGYAPVANDDIIARGNFVWGGEVALRVGAWARARLEDNTLGGARNLITRAGPLPEERGNRLYPIPRVPPAPAVFVRPNRYERGRAHVVVYNWRGRRDVAVDLSGVLRPGQRYELRSVQELWGEPAAAGTYRGEAVTLPLVPRPPADPVGRPTRAPPVTGPYFDVFLLTVSEAEAPRGRSRSPAR